MIKTPKVPLDSPIIQTIIDLESLKDSDFHITTPEGTFLQLKTLLHAVEAVASARIEGNHTTIASYLEKRDDSAYADNQQIMEISNLIKGLDFIDQYVMDEEISGFFIKELHSIVVDGLTREGDTRAGAWRTEPRYIANSEHQPPEPYDVPDLMRELVEYINEPTEGRYDLLKIAIANHRFVWIHPFGNGNGRTDRLLTYALLCKKGYIAPGQMRLFNPTAVFAGDREKYYDMLELADDYQDAHILKWCEYFLTGVRDEIQKSKSLTDLDFVSKKLLIPAIDAVFRSGFLTEIDANILRRAARLGTIKSADIESLWKSGTSRATIAKHINNLKERGLLRAIRENGREYELYFANSQLTRMTMEQMDRAGLLPIPVDR